MSYETLDVPIIFRNVTNHPITGLAHVAFKLLACSSSSFLNPGQLTAHGCLFVCFIFYKENELPGMIGNATFCCLSSDVKGPHQKATLCKKDPEKVH